jgi:hypothetical protein
MRHERLDLVVLLLKTRQKELNCSLKLGDSLILVVGYGC